MFTFKLNIFEEQGFNYPKYMIILKNSNLYYLNHDSVFYYLVSTIKKYTGIPCKFPTYLIVPDLYFDIYDEVVKFNLSKLGTDYIFNDICRHYKEECTGSYPENYIFVNEPEWPVCVEDIVDRTQLKRSYKYLWKN